jgi:outer membrane protein OmpA-like peptidoglycan-associated protein
MRDDLRATWLSLLPASLVAGPDFGRRGPDRGPTTSPPIALLVLALAVGAPAGAAAQDDFDDEFEDEEASAESEDGANDEATEEAPATAPANAEALRAERFLTHNTWGGPTGGIRVVDAGSGPRGTFRLQLATEFFFASDFLNEGDTNSHIGGSLSASWTPFDFLELFANLSSSANSNDTENPPLFQVLGDTTLGAKAFYTLPKVPWLTLGGDLTLALLNTVGDIGVVLKGTSLGLRANATADFRRLRSSIPLVARFNLQYWLDNSSQLTNDIERQRYEAIADRDPDYSRETRNLLSRVERFALGINRLDRLTFALGVEAPLKAAQRFFINPMLEWRLGVPINRQGYSCLYRPSDPLVPSSDPVAGDDGCLDVQGFAAMPQTLTLGVRVLPPVDGLAAFAAVDIGLTGVSTPVRELAATAPYNVMLGLSYAYDTREKVVTRTVEREVTREVVRVQYPPAKGRIQGIVLERGAGTPVAGAVVRFVGRDLTALHAGDDGTFTTYEFDPGEVEMQISHPEYHPGTCRGTIQAPTPTSAAGGDAATGTATGAAGATAATPASEGPPPPLPTVEVRCELEPLPRLGSVRGNVTGDTGVAVGGATVSISGPMSRDVRTDASGTFSLEGLAPGSYTARVEADGFLLKTATFEVRPREATNVAITLVTRPRQATVTVSRREIVIRRQIHFATDSDVIQASSTPLLVEIADVILRNPQITRIEIQGHTDNQGNAEHNLDLSQRRADAVRRWLIEQGGVQPSRLESKGYGMTRPLVPNITPANRARNRRVQFIILEQS